MKKVYLSILVMALCLTGVKQVNADLIHIIVRQINGQRVAADYGAYSCRGASGYCEAIIIYTPGATNNPSADVKRVEVVEGQFTGQTGSQISDYNVSGYNTPNSDWSVTYGAWSGAWRGIIPFTDFSYYGDINE
jgi:hypothetical protein